MSQPPWIPPTGGEAGDGHDTSGEAGGPANAASYRGAHSSGDEGAPPPDDLWGGPGTPGPWSGGADQPWATSSSTDPWAGAKSAWAAGPGDTDGPDDSGPAYPVPGAAGPVGPVGPVGSDTAPRPAPEPAPLPWASGTPDAPPNHTGAGYGPPSYADPSAPSAGPAVGEPAFGAGAGYAPPAQPGQQSGQQFGQPGQQFDQPGQPAQQPGPQFAPPAPQFAQPAPQFGPPGQPPGQPTPQPGQPSPAAPGQPQSGQPQSGEPFRSVRSDAVPPSAGAPSGPSGTPDRDLARPVAAPGGPDVYTPDPPPTLRPPQPQLPDSMSEVPQYAARLAPAPLPDGGPGTAPGSDQAPVAPGWGTPPPGAVPGDPGAPNQPPTGWPQQGGPAHAAGGTPPPAAMPRPEDLLVSSRPRQLEKPATWGWRGRLARWSGGAFKPKPSQAELADRQARLNAQRGFSRPMTVVVIQPKGGAGKTPTTICVASALGVRRGGYIVGWDNNETRGTLAVRTTNDDNQRTTAWDLLGRLDEFERSEARVGDLGYYMRAQGDAQFDALVSDDNPGNMAQIGEVEFRRIHQVLQRFYRMIIIDTGNNVRSTNWQAAVDQADQIVVVSTYQRDVGYSGSWVLDHLAQTGRDELARDAITVLTAAEPTVDQAVQTELVKHFTARTRAVVEVPYDPHIAEGGPIRWSELSEGSQRAWTSVAAAITQTLYDRDQRQLAARGRPGG